MKWSANLIQRQLGWNIFNRGSLLVMPNTYWTGNEIDLLVVTMNRRVIDCEIKISRSDLRADLKKHKWYHAWDWKTDGPWHPGVKGKPREWPKNVWKHYYVLPRDIWTDDLFESIRPNSGVLLMYELITHDGYNHGVRIDVKRNAKPDRTAEKISAEDALDIARLCNMRMWSMMSQQWADIRPDGETIEDAEAVPTM